MTIAAWSVPGPTPRCSRTSGEGGSETKSLGFPAVPSAACAAPRAEVFAARADDCIPAIARSTSAGINADSFTASPTGPCSVQPSASWRTQYNGRPSSGSSVGSVTHSSEADCRSGASARCAAETRDSSIAAGIHTRRSGRPGATHSVIVSMSPGCSARALPSVTTAWLVPRPVTLASASPTRGRRFSASSNTSFVPGAMPSAAPPSSSTVSPSTR